jgi:hypothetical protein
MTQKAKCLTKIKRWYMSDFMRIVEFAILILIAIAITAVTYGFITTQGQEPERFDSMLCRVHTPTAAILVNDELITCTNGKKYRWVG